MHIGGRGGWAVLSGDPSSRLLKRIYQYQLSEEFPLRGANVVTFYNPCKGRRREGRDGEIRRRKKKGGYGAIEMEEEGEDEGEDEEFGGRKEKGK